MADADELILQVLPVADSDAEELADLAAELHAELLSCRTRLMLTRWPGNEVRAPGRHVDGCSGPC